jgi:pilus assembly protein CpaB
MNAPATNVARRIRLRALIFLVLALTAGGAAVYLVKGYVDRLQGIALRDRQKQAKVVVAAFDIPIATELTEAQLKIVDWPMNSVPEGTFTEIPKLVGRTVQTSMVKGEAVLESRLADENAGRGLAAILGEGTRAMAVKVDQVVGVAGFVQPADYVDVITVMRPDEETKRGLGNNADRVSKIILQNIKVLAIGEQMVSTASNKPVKVSVVTLEVHPEEAEKLALASRHGEIQLTMRSRIDQDSVPTAGVTPIALLSPDEGTQRTTAAAKTDEKKPAPVRRAVAKAPPPKKEEPPAGPVVEILRGDKIEERKLKPSADSQ